MLNKVILPQLVLKRNYQRNSLYYTSNIGVIGYMEIMSLQFSHGYEISQEHGPTYL